VSTSGQQAGADFELKWSKGTIISKALCALVPRNSNVWPQGSAASTPKHHFWKKFSQTLFKNVFLNSLVALKKSINGGGRLFSTKKVKVKKKFY
jgi:hypothetical protein